ncbi:cell division protein FtsQ/DivIB [Phenylobacterium montanum]|uniref:Cell division protein FtsQ n=1 Tax=Phenylobacterium montanum TaxID=2823693 RepID=A0A975FZ12_9CAUL|nr:cell division protein FtsQ/DivIB [Caulobacter sp. S6]QUD87473.1 cell division protein FtsQ/DivIB [Caulobacter sp. S6]
MAVTVRGGAPSSPPKPRSKAPGGGPARGSAPAKPQPRAKGKPPKGPSRAYTPAKLGAVRGVGLPPHIALGVAVLAVLIALAGALVAERRGQPSAAAGTSPFDRMTAAIGLKVAKVEIEGAPQMAEDSIKAAAQVEAGQPILGLDLAALRARVEKVGWVKQARIVRLLPDTIVIAVIPRTTLAVWQHQGHTLVIDSEGHTIPEADPARFPQLPLVVGEGANDAAAQILPLVASRPRLTQRLDALVRVDGRRWDLRMNDGGLIQLPPTGEDAALIQLDQLDQKSRILELGFARIDLRDPEMVTVRPKDAAPGQAGTAGT